MEPSAFSEYKRLCTSRVLPKGPFFLRPALKSGFNVVTFLLPSVPSVFLNSPRVPRVDFYGTSTRTKGRSPSYLCTLFLSKGVHPKIVQEILGHSSTTITLDTYSHVLPNMQEKAVEAMEEILDGKD
jgi:hypothetical protein